MATSEDRKIALKRLINTSGNTVADFCRSHDLDPSYISQLLNGHRNIGEKAARKIEDKADLPQGFLDAEGEVLQSHESLLRSTHEEDSTIPIIGTLYFNKGQLWTQTDNVAEGVLPSVSCSRQAYAQRIKGMGIHNIIRDGWLITCDPQAALRAGEFVLLEQGKNTTIGEYLFESGDDWHIHAFATDERIILAKKDTRLIPILAITPPSRSKPASRFATPSIADKSEVNRINKELFNGD